MSLRSIATSARRSPTDTAICFAFDGGYLRPFKTMIASMVYHETMIDAPIIVISDDEAVFQDNVVREVVDEPRLICGSLLQTLRDLALNSVARQEKNRWHQGTFLKWAVFDNWRYRQVLFLDVDMVCNGPVEPFTELHPDMPLVACPQFNRMALLAEPRSHVADRLRDLLDGRFDQFHRRLNSGVMLIRPPVLSSHFRGELINFARDKEAANEQGLITEYVRTIDTPTMKLVGVAWNFQEHYLGAIADVSAAELLRRINILHYAGPTKPWSAKDASIRPSFALWSENHGRGISLGLFS